MPARRVHGPIVVDSTGEEIGGAERFRGRGGCGCRFGGGRGGGGGGGLNR